MTIEQRIAHLKNSITHYDQQPVYRLQIETTNAYKVMINGFPVGNNFGNITPHLNVIVNHALLESGDQRLAIQVHPSYHEDGSAQALSDRDDFSLRIVRTGLANGEQQAPETIYEFNLRDQEGYADKPTFALEDHFEAGVPYRLNGWSEAQPFNVSDSVTIKKKLYAAYKEMIEAYEKKDIDFIWNAYLDADAEWYQSEYLDAAAIEDFQRNYMRRGKTYTYGRATEAIDGVRFFPLENFNLAFYCDNKIACLEFASDKFKGESKFAYQAVASLGRNEVQFFDLFYMQDPKSGELVVVR
ncbi:hypothetical protein [Parapedobacter sp. 10938]|uniref:hypothetical protein n=1 Tax=Parapedobacter flavus TaxID=3110225 RepID=UPI002DBAD800|nr:hypothetical protein [Parapedobacter sp. 10938]MEC3879697.1 hypothetical protein [Parapedobacter sp. 10938]